MSATVSILHKIQDSREETKYSSAVEKSGSEGHDPHPKHRRLHWITAIGFSLILVSIIALNLRLFSVLKSYSADRGVTDTKVKELEETLNNNTQRLMVFSSDISKAMNDANRNFENVTAKIKEVDENLVKLNRSLDDQRSEISKLTQKSDAFQKTLNTLQARIDKLEKAPAQQ